MKSRICVRSMGLGAVIMFIGLAVGAIVSPPLGAQRNGVFDEITCRRLTVVDENGKTTLNVKSEGKENSITFYSPNGKPAIGLVSYKGLGFDNREINNNLIFVYDPNGKPAIRLGSNNQFGNAIAIFEQKQEGFGGTGIRLGVRELESDIAVYDQNRKMSFNFVARTDRNELAVYNKSDGAGIGFYADYNEAEQIKWNAPKED